MKEGLDSALKTFVYVGAAQGIGKAAALLFAKEGANVVVSDLDGGTSRKFSLVPWSKYLHLAKAQSVVEEIKAAGGEAIAIGGDG